MFVMTIVIFVLLVALCMILVESILPGRKWEKVSGWWVRAIALNAVQVGSVFLAGIAWDKWFYGLSLWSVEDALGVNGGAIAGYFVITFVYYWWHRLRHNIDFLWRWFHQLHHSPKRIEIITSFYKHPFEIIINSILSSFILYVVMGLGSEAASMAILVTGLAELFYHWNVKTPYWLGFIFQRPESHCIHHKENWHKNNFSDLPLWDILFGTFQNPKAFEEKCGFIENREISLTDMLRGIDVNKKARIINEE